jgi:hypothetical protein
VGQPRGLPSPIRSLVMPTGTTFHRGSRNQHERTREWAHSTAASAESCLSMRPFAGVESNVFNGLLQVCDKVKGVYVRCFPFFYRDLKRRFCRIRRIFVFFRDRSRGARRRSIVPAFRRRGGIRYGPTTPWHGESSGVPRVTFALGQGIAPTAS